jgi:ribosome-binding protein aMBF1 (putative translation factor)
MMTTKKVASDEKIWYGLDMAIAPEQCRAARGWLGWSQQELARQANVGLSTVKALERGDGKLISATAEAIQRAIEQAGIRLLTRADGSAEGIAARSPD